jgi:hypothetical protein
MCETEYLIQGTYAKSCECFQPCPESSSPPATCTGRHCLCATLFAVYCPVTLYDFVVWLCASGHLYLQLLTYILPRVWYGCETWSLTLMKGHRFRALRRIFGPKRVDDLWRRQNCIMWISIICSLHQILFGWSNHNSWTTLSPGVINMEDPCPGWSGEVLNGGTFVKADGATLLWG